MLRPFFLLFFYFSISAATSASTRVLDDEGYILISPSTTPVHMPTGSDFSLLCKVTKPDYETMSLDWIKFGEEQAIFKTNHTTVTRLDSVHISMTIKNASLEDSGVYHCVSLIDGVSHIRNVDVNFFEEINFLDKQTDYGHIVPTASVNVSCETTTRKGNVKTHWIRYGKELFDGKNIKFYNDNSIMEISNFNVAENAGRYTCEVHPLTGLSPVRKIIRLGTRKEHLTAKCTSLCTNLCIDMEAKNYYEDD